MNSALFYPEAVTEPKLQGVAQELQLEIKMQEQDLRRTELQVKQEAGEKDLHVVQSGTIKEFLSGESLLHIKQEPEEGLLQHWEGQWQDFLKMAESPYLGWRPLKLPESKAEEDPKALQTSLKETAGVSHWTAPTAKDLRGRHKLLRGLDPPLRENGEMVSAEAVSSEMQRQHFRQFCYQEADGPRDACRQLWKLCHQWLKPEKHSKDKILEVLILEQFLMVLPLEMQNWVSKHVPETCGQAVDLAEDFLQKLQPPESWERKESELLMGSIVNMTSSTQKAQISVKGKQEEDEESSFFGGDGQMQENGEEMFQLNIPEQSLPVLPDVLQSFSDAPYAVGGSKRISAPVSPHTVC
uniref:SCAN box domain-containing protein n=1 Tax=Salvator merianae TaxID=96440 RepID=A0A8D0C3R3_SALMN